MSKAKIKVIRARCTECGEVVEPTVLNPPACEAQCPECGEWFCYSDTSGRVSTAIHDGAAEHCEMEYNGKADYRW